ncbi:Phosphatidylinositol 3-kinase tor2 [Smittium culicis]|uniref:non-specific serine/threonine protein kinase n=1 Tax=Smittium culicis TaxID=133412 RepID=A0A1R1XW46_9FUNG|nr:Phosphatidylinositol 3-kinase tor2 [Smittium culicis]
MPLSTKKNHNIFLNSETFDELVNTSIFPETIFTHLKYKWAIQERTYAIKNLKLLVENLSKSVGFNFDSFCDTVVNNQKSSAKRYTFIENEPISESPCFRLLSNLYYTKAEWLLEINKHIFDIGDHEFIDDSNRYNTSEKILNLYLASLKFDKNSYNSWNSLAVWHCKKMSQIEMEVSNDLSESIKKHIIPSIHSFFKSIDLSDSFTEFQDLLQLLKIWFKYGHLTPVSEEMAKRFNDIDPICWIQVLPQIIARVDSPHIQIISTIKKLLIKLGKSYPESILFPLTVSRKISPSNIKNLAFKVIETLRYDFPELIYQSDLVADELSKVATSIEEKWLSSIDEASRKYFICHDIDGMMDILISLISSTKSTTKTIVEERFYQEYQVHISEISLFIEKLAFSKNNEDLDIVRVINRIWISLKKMFIKFESKSKKINIINLQEYSPKLFNSKNLIISIPGTFKPNEEKINIYKFHHILKLYTSKQRPRNLIIHGSDGLEYRFLLKGNEDLRQDERIMQIFNLINMLLLRAPEAFSRHLKIERFPIIPISPNSGLIGFYDNCETLHSIIKKYRESISIPLSSEQRKIQDFAPDYEKLDIVQKVEAFSVGLSATKGDELKNIFWIKSTNAEDWIYRRSNFTRSLSVMSFVGYIIGLGDRHPSNFMIHNITGKVVHIDFGDCFESTMNRELHPEHVPFRLTRILINAMEINSIQGSFKIASETTLRILRSNKESLMTALEAFIYDPLIGWVLSEKKINRTPQKEKSLSELMEFGYGNKWDNKIEYSENKPSFGIKCENLKNQKATDLMDRIEKKLDGLEFNTKESIDICSHVERLVEQATSLENLCRCFIGWCAFW